MTLRIAGETIRLDGLSPLDRRRGERDNGLMSPGGERVDDTAPRSRPGEHDHGDPAALEKLRDRLNAYMAKKGLRSTAQRRLIVDTFFGGSPHMTIEDLLTEVRARTLEEFGPLLRHAGEEYFMVTRGTIAVHTEFYAPEILREGDGMYIDSTMGHAYLNAGATESAQGICLCTSESADLFEQLHRIASRDADS